MTDGAVTPWLVSLLGVDHSINILYIEQLAMQCNAVIAVFTPLHGEGWLSDEQNGFIWAFLSPSCEQYNK